MARIMAAPAAVRVLAPWGARGGGAGGAHVSAAAAGAALQALLSGGGGGVGEGVLLEQSDELDELHEAEEEEQACKQPRVVLSAGRGAAVCGVSLRSTARNVEAYDWSTGAYALSARGAPCAGGGAGGCFACAVKLPKPLASVELRLRYFEGSHRAQNASLP